ncbi:MAG: UDP-N-acetylmuramoyl-tripeptide--D-alanyl-D-alanine ligase, partial [Proteobacteria bacterium]|nr:UDP-N-acetylmuramoyl-tripeptide--D-alanyl-D-alanine ligase [Pseudomonadota bacterium]
MDATSLTQIAQWSGGVLVGDGSAEVRRVVTDSRKAMAGDLFVALKGERFDGHDFLGQVAEQGVSGALVQGGNGERPNGLNVVEVGDVLTGLQRLAGAYRQTLPARVVGITGSSGKTTTKDFTFAVLSAQSSGWCTQGNLNNHIGLPLTLLSGRREHAFAVVEMGMNHAGEIAPLADLASPEVAIITNVGVAHIEFLGSREAIAREKGSLAARVGEQGTVVLSAEDEYTPLIASLTKARI